jgi:chromosome segregation ATPase
MILDMVNQNVQVALKKFQDNKNEEYEKTQKQINELIGALNKNQSETENTINREINEIRAKIDTIKEELIHDMENLRKKNETEIQNKMEGHSSRLEQTEDRILELKVEMVIKGKNEELLVSQLKTCERNMQELTDSIKRQNLGIMSTEEGEEVPAKGICNTFNKIITENFPNLQKTMSIQVQDAPRHQTDFTKIELPHDILSLKQQAQRLEKECRRLKERKNK